MIENYQKHWKTPLPPDFEFAFPEQEVIVNIPGTSHQIRAIFDGLLRSKRGTYVVLERKTFDPRYAPTDESLRTNFQFVGYTWIARELKFEPIAGIAYDGLRKQKAPGKTGKATSLSDLFVRTVVPFTSARLDNFGQDLALVVNEMANDPAIYPHRPWDGCRKCPFDRLCESQSNGEDYEHLIQLNYQQRPDTRPILSVVS